MTSSSEDIGHRSVYHISVVFLTPRLNYKGSFSVFEVIKNLKENDASKEGIYK